MHFIEQNISKDNMNIENNIHTFTFFPRSLCRMRNSQMLCHREMEKFLHFNCHFFVLHCNVCDVIAISEIYCCNYDCFPKWNFAAYEFFLKLILERHLYMWTLHSHGNRVIILERLISFSFIWEQHELWVSRVFCKI